MAFDYPGVQASIQAGSRSGSNRSNLASQFLARQIGGNDNPYSIAQQSAASAGRLNEAALNAGAEGSIRTIESMKGLWDRGLAEGGALGRQAMVNAAEMARMRFLATREDKQQRREGIGGVFGGLAQAGLGFLAPKAPAFKAPPAAPTLPVAPWTTPKQGTA